jgi:hypothetical protein
VRPKELGGVCAPPPAPRPEIAAILSAPLPESALAAATDRSAAESDHGPATASQNGTQERLPASKGVPTPKDLAALRAPGTQPVHQPAGATLRWSSDKGWVDRPVAAESQEAASLPTLAQLTTAEQRWADREEDITTVGGDPYEVGQVFARRWISRLADPAQVQKLSGMYPRVPHRIDGELLRYAARFGLLAHKDDQIDEHDRYAIRAGFWREIDQRTTAEAPVGE